jgi:hypothetical protein
MDNENRWVTWNGTNMLWLPPEYRPAVSAVKEGGVAIGCSSGVVYILNFYAKSPGFTSLQEEKVSMSESRY